MIDFPATKARCVAEKSLKSGILRHGRQRPSVCAAHPPQHPAAVPVCSTLAGDESMSSSGVESA
jgi:hypothetical protein